MVKGWICWLFNYLEKEGRKKQDKKSIKIISVWLWHIQRLTSLFPPSALPVFSPSPPSLPPWTHLFLPSLLPVLISLGINLSSFWLWLLHVTFSYHELPCFFLNHSPFRCCKLLKSSPVHLPMFCALISGILLPCLIGWSRHPEIHSTSFPFYFLSGLTNSIF